MLYRPFCASFAVPTQSDKYYDLCGALGYVSASVISLYYPFLKAKFWYKNLAELPPLSTQFFAPRQLLIAAAVGIWSLRLGSFLAHRSIKAGGDSRFAVIKTQPRKFLYYWMAQATWVSLVGLPLWLINTLPSTLHPELGYRDYASLALFASSFLLEVAADAQKSKWRARKDRKEHDEKFITTGLWRWSRHPNYIGEVGIWTGIWGLATSSLQTSHFPPGAVALAGISPLFTWFLLRKVSGVPPLERAGDKKFGDDPQWKEYKRTVPVFWPWGDVE